MVSFGGRRVRGLVVDLADETDVAESRLRPVGRLLGEHVWVTGPELDLFRWAAARQAAPLADVVRHALPARVVEVERSVARAGWWPWDPATETGTSAVPGSGVATGGPGAGAAAAAVPVGWSRYRNGVAELWAGTTAQRWTAAHWRPVAFEDVGARLSELARQVIAGGRSVLVVTPEPVSSAADRLAADLGDVVADVRGGPTNRVAYRAWLRGRAGDARVLIGERGVCFWPLERLGLVVVLDEANPALKERRSPRHHVREVALERARRGDATALLVGHVPSAPARRLIDAGRLATVTAPRKVERSHAPIVRLAGERPGPRTRLSRESTAAIRQAVADGQYAVVLASRRGEGRALVCSSCGVRSTCPTCDSGLTHDPREVRCDVCGWRRGGRPTCRACRRDRFAPLAAGAGRIASELERTVKVPVAVLEGYAPSVPASPAVLVCTRGAVVDHPPGPVGTVVLADVDALLRRASLDAAEDTLRLCLRAASWVGVGRGGPGSPGGGSEDGANGTADIPERDASHPVMLETRDPEHTVIRALRTWDPDGFWRAETAVRESLRFPPAGELVHLDGPACGPDDGWVGEVRAALPDEADVLGPLPVDGGVRLLVKTDQRVATVEAIAGLRPAWSKAGLDVRVDVDPALPD